MITAAQARASTKVGLEEVLKEIEAAILKEASKGKRELEYKYTGNLIQGILSSLEGNGFSAYFDGNTYKIKW